MRLVRLRMQNFRQHVDTKIEFRAGLTGIIGPNGAGKSTILEAIAWSLYGAKAARGTNDTIRFSRAAPRARVVVDFTFELDNHEYRVSRTLNSADVYLDNGVNPVATGVGAATAYLQGKLGMTRDEFFNTYFTGQKELQFLAQMGAMERGRFLAQVLGYERLRKAQDIAKDRRKELAAQIEGLKTGLADPGSLKKEREDAEERLKAAKKNVSAIQKKIEKLQADLEAVTPSWIEAQAKKERAGKLTFELDIATRELSTAQRDVDRAAVELRKVTEAEQSLAALKPRLEELASLSATAEKLEELSRAHARRGVLQQNEERLVTELEKLDVTLDVLKQAPALLKKAQEELADLKKSLPQIEEARERLLTAWQQDKQENTTLLAELAAQQKEIEEQIAKLKNAGEAGSCPICTKPLGDEYGTVLEHLQLELEDRRNIIKWRNSRAKQLAQRPDALVEAEQRLTQLHLAIEKKTEREAKCAQGAKDLWERGQERQAKNKELVQLRAELAGVPAGYDADEHARVRTRLAELQQVARQATVFEHEISSRKAREKELAAAQQRHASINERIAQLRAEVKDLGFNEKAYEKVATSFEKVKAEAQAALINDAQAQQALAGAEEALFMVKRAEAAYEEKKQKLVVLESELRHHTEMDVAVARLRTELNARVRPELGELASEFLTEITDGRYNALDIDESYNVMVLEDGEEKPVISGGEEDIANLVLRIAISQMIAERAGQRLSALFLDEVFASLDIERRDNVIHLLQKLHDRFEQVILITHVETVREGLDHVIRLSYDERSGASVVKEETPAPELALLV